jgi:hypothetical protein
MVCGLEVAQSRANGFKMEVHVARPTLGVGARGAAAAA